MSPVIPAFFLLARSVMRRPAKLRQLLFLVFSFSTGLRKLAEKTVLICFFDIRTLETQFSLQVKVGTCI